MSTKDLEPSPNRPFFVEKTSTKDKYKLFKPKDPHPIALKNEIYITNEGKINKYFGYGAEFLSKNKNETLIIKGTGKAISKAFLISELLRKKFSSLYQQVSVTAIENDLEYLPLEEGLDKVTVVKFTTLVEIKLSSQILDENHYGYQPPNSLPQIEEKKEDDKNFEQAKKKLKREISEENESGEAVAERSKFAKPSYKNDKNSKAESYRQDKNEKYERNEKSENAENEKKEKRTKFNRHFYSTKEEDVAGSNQRRKDGYRFRKERNFKRPISEERETKKGYYKESYYNNYESRNRKERRPRSYSQNEERVEKKYKTNYNSNYQKKKNYKRNYYNNPNHQKNYNYGNNNYGGYRRERRKSEERMKHNKNNNYGGYNDKFRHRSLSEEKDTQGNYYQNRRGRGGYQQKYTFSRYNNEKFINYYEKAHAKNEEDIQKNVYYKQDKEALKPFYKENREQTSQNHEKNDRFEKFDKFRESKERNKNYQRNDRYERNEKYEKEEKYEKGDKYDNEYQKEEKYQKSSKYERPEHKNYERNENERFNKNEKYERNEKYNQFEPERTEKYQKFEQYERPEKKEIYQKYSKSEKPENKETPEDSSEKKEFKQKPTFKIRGGRGGANVGGHHNSRRFNTLSNEENTEFKHEFKTRGLARRGRGGREGERDEQLGEEVGGNREFKTRGRGRG